MIGPPIGQPHQPQPAPLRKLGLQQPLYEAHFDLSMSVATTYAY
ncbi:hypothetical protein ACIQRJ_06280 [Streptomyces niveus]